MSKQSVQSPTKPRKKRHRKPDSPLEIARIPKNRVPGDIRLVIARNIRGRLRERKLNQHDLAIRFGLNVQAVSNFLNYSTRHYFSLLRTAQIADWLKCSVADLCTPDRFPYDGPEDQRVKS